MYRALHLPQLPLLAALSSRSELANHPVAVVSEKGSPQQKFHLLALNSIAAQYDIHPGFTTARALARCPELELLDRDPQAEGALQKLLLDYAETISPDLEITAPDTLIATLTTRKASGNASEPVFDHPLLTAQAATPDLAHLLTQVSAGEPLGRAPLRALLTTFPHHFQTTAQLRDLSHTLSTWGLRTIGDFTELPRPDLHERLGPHAALLHDIATGRHHRLLTLYRPPKDYQQHLDLDHPVETLSGLLLILRHLLHTLTARLQAHQRVPASLTLTLHFDDKQQHHSCLRIPEPTTDPAPLIRILETHLDGLTAPAPIVALTLDTTPTQATRAQSDLFQKALRDPNQFAHTLNQLTALLGAEQLGIPSAQDTHRPDQFILFPPEELFAKSSPQPAKGSPTRDPTPPLKRLRPPLSIQALTTPQNQPQALLTGPYPGPLTHLAGPYRLHGHWWHPPDKWSRTEWDAQLHQGPLARLIHQAPHRWEIEGYY